MKNSVLSSIVWGVIVIALGVGFLLNSLNIMNFGQFISDYWPVVLIVIGILELLKNQITGGLIWLAVGIIFILKTLGVYNFDVWSLILPAVIIIIGFNILVRSGSRSRIKTEQGESVSANSVFGGSEKKVDSKNFKVGTLNAIFGGSKIDLRQAGLSEEGSIIDVLVMFGGGEIILPKNTRISLETTAIFGGCDDKRKEISESPDRRMLKIRGLILFGGLEIKD